MTQVGFPRSEAHEALDQFLADPDGMGRWIGEHDDTGGGGNPDYGGTAAHIVGGDAYDKIMNGYSQWLEAQEVRDEAAEPPGYAPWRHSPLATTDRLLPHEPLRDTIARSIFRKDFANLDETDQLRCTGAAIMCVLRVRHDPDGQGAVPVMMVTHDGDEPGPGLRWQIAYVTEVPGLFLRVTGNGFFGEEWGIVTGSGYRLTSGWFDRDQAAACVSALGRVLPNTDWMRLGPDGYTPRAKAAIKDVLAKYHRYWDNSETPDPEVVTDEVPAPDDPQAAVEAAKGMTADA